MGQMKEMKVVVGRKIYLGRYETEHFSIEGIYDVDEDFSKEYKEHTAELEPLVTQVAEEYRKKHEDRMSEQEKALQGHAKALIRSRAKKII